MGGSWSHAFPDCRHANCSLAGALRIGPPGSGATVTTSRRLCGRQRPVRTWPMTIEGEDMGSTNRGTRMLTPERACRGMCEHKDAYALPAWLMHLPGHAPLCAGVQRAPSVSGTFPSPAAALHVAWEPQVHRAYASNSGAPPRVPRRSTVADLRNMFRHSTPDGSTPQTHNASSPQVALQGSDFGGVPAGVRPGQQSAAASGHTQASSKQSGAGRASGLPSASVEHRLSQAGPASHASTAVLSGHVRTSNAGAGATSTNGISAGPGAAGAAVATGPESQGSGPPSYSGTGMGAAGGAEGSAAQGFGRRLIKMMSLQRGKNRTSATAASAKAAVLSVPGLVRGASQRSAPHGIIMRDWSCSRAPHAPTTLCMEPPCLYERCT